MGASDVRPSLLVHISVRPSLCQSPSVCHLSVRFSVHPSLCPSLRPSVILSVSVRPSLCPSVSQFVSVRPSVTCPSLCSPCSSRYLSHVLIDPVVHCNLSYTFFHFSRLSQHPLVVDKFCCVRVRDCFWVSIYRRPDGTFSQATWRCRYKQRSPYCMVMSHCAQIGGPADHDLPV